MTINNWQDKIIKKVNEKAQKKGVRCDDSHPLFEYISEITKTKVKTLKEYKQLIESEDK